MEYEIIKIVVTSDQTPERIDAYLGKHAESGLTRTAAEKLISSGNILVNDKAVDKKYKVKPNDLITIPIIPPEVSEINPENIPLDIVHEDEHLAVINKPAGMVTHPGVGNRSGTLVNALLYHFQNLADSSDPTRPGIVHRLDKDTSGLLLIAKNNPSYLKLQDELQKREVKRTYWALICGHLKEMEGTINLPIGRSIRDRKKMAVTEVNSRNAITEYKVIGRYRTYDLLEVNLQTGRTHQIRVHLSHLGHPVFGDSDYGGREKWHKGIFAPERPLGKTLLKILSRQALHAKKLEFNHPDTGEQISLEIDLPADFQNILDLLENEGS